MTNDTLLHHPPDDAKPVVACDLEGTLSAGSTWRGMADYLREHGRKRRFRNFYLKQLPRLLLFRLGVGDERAFKESWILNLLRQFAGMDVAEFREMAGWVVERELLPNVRPSLVAELEQHREEGRRVIIISGMFEPILAEFATRLGEYEAIGTPVQVEDGTCTGETAAPLNVGERKVAQLAAFAREGEIAVAYGDTKRDIPMLEMARQPVAVDPDAELREVAVARGWRIIPGREAVEAES